MILIADSGSTKTDWCIVFNDTPIKRIGTKGINPFFQSEEEIQQELTHSLLPQLPEGTINSVFFYVERQKLILEYLKQNRKATTNELSEMLDRKSTRLNSSH